MSLSKSQRILVQELSCPICLHLFSKPVILPCGHSYCLACIQCAMEANKGPPHHCPECREEYPADRELQKNFSLCSIVEGYKETAAGGEAPAEAVVLCEECQGTGRPAVKTCLKCEVSLCSQHMQRHLQKESVKRHILAEPPSPTEGVMCLLHHKAPEYFCGSDSTLLCTSCFIEGNHHDHDVKTLEIAEVEMRQVIESHRKVLQNKLQMLESLVQRGIEDEAIFKAANNKLAAKVLALLGGMAELVSGYRARLGQLLQEEQSLLEEGWEKGLRQMGDQQDLLRATQQDAALVLGETDKCIFVHRFLKVEPAIKAAIGGLVSAPVLAPIIVKKLSSSARTDSFKAEMGRMLQALHVLLSPLELTFNPNTAHQSLVISNDQRTVKYSATKQSHPDHSERFLSAPQVLCSQGFTSGEHIWVVEVGQCMWSVGLSYKSIPRRGDHSRLGHNPVSWRVQWKNRKLTACHESSNVVLPETVPPQRVEVTLDYDGGMLSFHSVMGRREHLHTFRASFREPVYPAFSIHSTTPQSWITLQN